MSLIGNPQAATLSGGAESLSADGTNDYGEVSLPSSLEGSSLTEFAVEFAIEWTETNPKSIMTQFNDANQTLNIQANVKVTSSGRTANAGDLQFDLRDSGGDRLEFGTSGQGLNDGNRHDITAIWDDTTTNSVRLFIDGAQATPNTAVSQGPSNFTTWDYNMPLWARVSGGSIDNYLDAKIGALRVHDAAPSGQSINAYEY